MKLGRNKKREEKERKGNNPPRIRSAVCGTPQLLASSTKIQNITCFIDPGIMLKEGP